MKLIFQPVQPFYVGQKFGENRACVSLDGTKRVISCDGKNPPEGYKSLYGANGHDAIDIGTWHGQPVYAAQDGVVYSIDTKVRSGLDVRIEHRANGMTFRTIYEHLLGYQPKEGDRVRVGELIGWADNTGYSSGDHCHFVLELLQPDGSWKRVDPLLYMEPIFARDWLAVENKFLYLKQSVALLLEGLVDKLRT